MEDVDLLTYRIAEMFGSRKVWRIVHDSTNLTILYKNFAFHEIKFPTLGLSVGNLTLFIANENKLNLVQIKCPTLGAKFWVKFLVPQVFLPCGIVKGMSQK